MLPQSSRAEVWTQVFWIQILINAADGLSVTFPKKHILNGWVNLSSTTPYFLDIVLKRKSSELAVRELDLKCWETEVKKDMVSFGVCGELKGRVRSSEKNSRLERHPEEFLSLGIDGYWSPGMNELEEEERVEFKRGKPEA